MSWRCSHSTETENGRLPGRLPSYKYIRMERKEPNALGRPRIIDRNKVLDAAEAVVAKTGAAGLTMDAVARAAGITKGGVQYCFGSKEGLIKSMIERWSAGFDEEVTALAGDNPAPPARLRAYVEASQRTDDAESSRSASMLATLIQSSDRLADTRAWYRDQLRGLDFSSEEGRKARLAFMAAEGVFFLRSFRFLELTEQEWQSVFEDILRLLPHRPEADETTD